ncbi:hypothetical protein D918_02213 [Trichuris suis]|nr:hypothetical protein D918_02213 [Trichuris suis]
MSNNSTLANGTLTSGMTNITLPDVDALEKWWNDYFFIIPILLSALTFVCLIYYINVLRMNSQGEHPSKSKYVQADLSDPLWRFSNTV